MLETAINLANKRGSLNWCVFIALLLNFLIASGLKIPFPTSFNSVSASLISIQKCLVYLCAASTPLFVLNLIVFVVYSICMSLYCRGAISRSNWRFQQVRRMRFTVSILSHITGQILLVFILTGNLIYGLSAEINLFLADPLRLILIIFVGLNCLSPPKHSLAYCLIYWKAAEADGIWKDPNDSAN